MAIFEMSSVVVTTLQPAKLPRTGDSNPIDAKSKPAQETHATQIASNAPVEQKSSSEAKAETPGNQAQATLWPLPADILAILLRKQSDVKIEIDENEQKVVLKGALESIKNLLAEKDFLAEASAKYAKLIHVKIDVEDSALYNERKLHFVFDSESGFFVLTSNSHDQSVFWEYFSDMDNRVNSLFQPGFVSEADPMPQPVFVWNDIRGTRKAGPEPTNHALMVPNIPTPVDNGSEPEQPPVIPTMPEPVTPVVPIVPVAPSNPTPPPNQAPIGNSISDQIAGAGVGFALDISGNFTDADMHTLTYTAMLQGGGALPTWLSFNNLSGEFSGTPAIGDVGAITVVVTASDGRASTSETFTLGIYALLGTTLDDTLTGGSVYGDSGNDELNGTVGDDSLVGAQGADLLQGGAGNDWMDGGVGNDTLYGQDGDDSIYGGTDDDFILGDGGNDVAYGEAGDDTLYGWTGNDTLYGGDGADLLSGEANNDSLIGGSGSDSLHGGDNEDTLQGGDDNDFLYGGGGYDSLEGGNGNDYLDAGSENDTLYGGAGSDSLYGGNNEDTLYGGDDNDFLYGGGGYDLLDGESGDDYLDAGSENDTLYGGTGSDTLLGGLNEDTLYGGDGNDFLYGGAGYDSLIGGGGDDYLEAGTEEDTLSGGAGSDTLLGGDNDDTMYGGEGSDYYTGGVGNDHFIIDYDNVNGDNDHITDMTSGQDKIGFSSAHYLFTGVFSAAGFAGGSFAGSGGATFLYDSTDGQVWYDADADGAGTSLLVATIDNFAGYAFDSGDFITW